ncbi:MAG: rRNA maturation RNase YbeY [Robiginitomaculum sp.]|nr:rRNA maturation RNase YbeY [Robiginitomaculum sp.]
MPVEIQLSSSLADNVYVPSKELFVVWVGAVLRKQAIDEAELSIRIVDESESQDLNKEYRDKNTPTNVLSFSLGVPEYVMPRILGDLVICAEVVAVESQTQDKPRDAHWAHMVVHGVLHLLGFDHQADEQAQQMEGLEIEVMQGLGFANPYE